MQQCIKTLEVPVFPVHFFFNFDFCVMETIDLLKSFPLTPKSKSFGNGLLYI